LADASSHGKRRPERSCIACRQSRSKRELIRIVREPTGSVSVDTTGKLSGRGAYICALSDCLEQSTIKGSLERQLHLEQLLTDDQFATILENGLAVVASTEARTLDKRITA
jgi:predicted RNA-binding protein YlxR (DUF448 family)